MPEITFPAAERKIRWSKDGDWLIGEVEVSNDRGVVATLTGRLSESAIVEISRNLREQLARQAPAGVDVGAWVDLHGGAQQDLHRYVLERELEKSIANQVRRRGWVVEPPWFGDWNADVVARAYRLIQAAYAGDPMATTQLDTIRSGAMKDNPQCVEALGKFSAVGRMIAKGMSLDAVFAALGVSAAEVGVIRRGGRSAPARVVARPIGRMSARGSTSSPTARASAPQPARVVPRPLAVARAPMVARPISVAQPYPYPQQPQYPYGYQPGGSGGDSGGGGGGGDNFPVDDLGDMGDQGEFNDLDDMSDPIPPPEGDDGWDEEEARAGAKASDPDDDLERESPPDDGSGERPFAAAPGGGGGAEAGGAEPDGTPESGAEVNTKTDGSDGGMGVEMVPDLGEDVYPDEGAPMGSK